MTKIITSFTATPETVTRNATGQALVYLARLGHVGYAYLKAFIDGRKTVEQANAYVKFIASKNKLGFFRITKKEGVYTLLLSSQPEPKKKQIKEEEIEEIIASLDEETAKKKRGRPRKHV